MKTLSIQFLCPPIVSISDLIRNPTLLLKPLGFTKTQANLSYEPRVPASYGQFKIAQPGTITPPVFGTNPKVCLKQCFFVHPESHEWVTYDSARQAEQLTTELNCIGWGSCKGSTRMHTNRYTSQMKTQGLREVGAQKPSR
jgi:hypothetical protein